MNTSKWAQDFAAPTRPLEELRIRYEALRRDYEGLLQKLDAVQERHRLFVGGTDAR